MTEKKWYYIFDDKEEGPVSEIELRQMLDRGELAPQTPVFHEDMERFAPASKVEPFRSRIQRRRNSFSGRRGEQYSESQPVEFADTSVSLYCPWVRWWARFFDYLLFAFVCMPFVVRFAPRLLEVHEMILAMLTVFVWIFVESWLLSTWGSTPGKWLLKTTLLDANNQKLSFNMALKRSFYVWSVGMGIGYPILTLVTLIMGYRTLTTHGITRWDEAGNLMVKHERIGPLRSFLTIVLFLFLISRL